MTSPTVDPTADAPAPRVPAPPVQAARSAEHRPGVPESGNTRLAGLALMAGCVLATIGFLGVSIAVRGSGDARYTDPRWAPLYGVVLAGNILVVLGLPAVLAVMGRSSRRLSLIGYVGVFAPLVMLNVAETTLEAFIKPYLARHGGIPKQDPTGLVAFEGVALLLLIVGCGCLAAAVFRTRVQPVWVGVALIASVLGAFVLHGDATEFISDYCIFAALFQFGRAATRRPAVASTR